MPVLYANNATSTLAAGIASGATSLSVQTGHGARFPAISGSDYFYVTLTDAAANIEIVRVTARSTDTFTITRAQDGTSARAWNASDTVELRVTKAMLDDIKADVRAPRVSCAASAASLTPDISSFDQYAYTALAVGLTINAPVGTPVDGNKLVFRLLDNGTTRALTWNATYTAIGGTLPTATTANKTTYVGCIYNANNTRWDVIAVVTQA